MKQGNRRLGTIFAVTMLLASTLAWAGATGSKPAAGGSDADKAARIERGRYLVAVMGCGDCHTPGTFYGSPDFSRRLSGSDIAWKGPWGVSYARNLTPDLETGIGYYSEDELVNALRTGVRPSGGAMLPPMPWQNTAQLTEPDLHAVAAYLLSLPAVKHDVPDAVAPGKPFTGPAVEFPPPPAWDAPRPADRR